MNSIKLLFILLVFPLLYCSDKADNKELTKYEISSKNITETSQPKAEITERSIHVIVALCDNKYQGIVPVGRVIGNGQDPKNNLYWGAAYGVKTFFNKSKDWKLLKSESLNDTILERLVYKHNSKNIYLIADAYNGKYIKKATEDFLKSSSGNSSNTLNINDKIVGIQGNAELISYIGHNGLMDFDLDETYVNSDNKKRNVMIYACYSRNYFKPHIQQANGNALVWSTGLMAPEAYILHNALDAYVNNKDKSEIATKAAEAYNQYQKCGLNAAKRLLVSD